MRFFRMCIIALVVLAPASTVLAQSQTRSGGCTVADKFLADGTRVSGCTQGAMTIQELAATFSTRRSPPPAPNQAQGGGCTKADKFLDDGRRVSGCIQGAFTIEELAQRQPSIFGVRP